VCAAVDLLATLCVVAWFKNTLSHLGKQLNKKVTKFVFTLDKRGFEKSGFFIVGQPVGCFKVL